MPHFNIKTQRGRQLDGSPNRIDILVGKHIKMKRKSLNLTQQDVAQKLGISFQQFQKYENAQNRVSASRLWDLSQVLNEPINSFFIDIDENIARQSPRFMQNMTDD